MNLNKLTFPLSDDPCKDLEKEDLYRRKALVERMTQLISNYKGGGSFRVGVCGDWGSGKTSFINFVANALSGKETLKVVKIAPWDLVHSNNLAVGLLEQIDASTKDWLSQVKDGGIEVSKKLNKMTQILSLVGGFVFGEPIGSSVAAAGNMLEVLKTTGMLDSKSLNDLKKEVSEVLTEKGIQLVIILDDLDRLPKDRIQEVFRLVGSIADFSNTTYILSMDRDRVAQALNDIFGNGYQYLEKFLTVDFNLPKVEKVLLRRMVDSCLYKVLAEYGISLQEETQLQRLREFWFFGLENLIEQPRDIVRIFNSYHLLLSLIKDDTDIIDLFIVATLEAKTPGLSKLILENIYIFVPVPFGFFADIERADKDIDSRAKRLSKILTEYFGKDEDLSIKRLLYKKNVEALLNKLFPKLTDSSYKTQDPLISNYKNFKNYFNYQVPEEFITEAKYSEFHDKLLTDLGEDEISKWLGGMSDNQQLDFFDKFLERIHRLGDDGAFKVKNSDLLRVVCSLFKVSHLLSDETGTVILFDSQQKRVLREIVQIQVKMNSLERYKGQEYLWYEDVWEGLKEYTFISGFVTYLAENKQAKKDKRRFIYALEETEVKVSLRLEEILETGIWDNFERLGELLSQWIAIENQDKKRIEIYLKNLIARDKKAVWGLISSLIQPVNQASIFNVKEILDENVRRLRRLFSLNMLEAAWIEEAFQKDELFETFKETLKLWKGTEEVRNSLEQNIVNYLTEQYLEKEKLIGGIVIRQQFTDFGRNDITDSQINEVLFYLSTSGFFRGGRDIGIDDWYEPTLEAFLKSRFSGEITKFLEGMLKYYSNIDFSKFERNETHKWEVLNKFLPDFTVERTSKYLRLSGLGKNVKHNDNGLEFHLPYDKERITKLSDVNEFLEYHPTRNERLWRH